LKEKFLKQREQNLLEEENDKILQLENEKNEADKKLSEYRVNFRNSMNSDEMEDLNIENEVNNNEDNEQFINN
jgi:hypothetical protein